MEDPAFERVTGWLQCSQLEKLTSQTIVCLPSTLLLEWIVTRKVSTPSRKKTNAILSSIVGNKCLVNDVVQIDVLLIFWKRKMIFSYFIFLGLQASLLVRHPDTGELYVNCDPQLIQLIRETEYMMKLNLPIPETARLIFLRRDIIKTVDGNLKVGDLSEKYIEVNLWQSSRAWLVFTSPICKSSRTEWNSSWFVTDTSD